MPIIHTIYIVFLVESKEEARLRAHYRLRLARILYKNDTIPNEAQFNAITSTIFEHRHVRSGTTKQWTFPGAFYFSTLVVTLIGKFLRVVIDSIIRILSLKVMDKQHRKQVLNEYFFPSSLKR
jgi:hypothetical protein